MFPPHLPSPMSSISQHRQWQGIKFILFITGFGFVAGVSGAAVLLGYIWPNLVAQNLDINQSKTVSSHITLDSRTAHDADERIVKIFRLADGVGGAQILNNGSFMGYGLVVSSDGWLATYNKNLPSNFNNWQVLFADGTVKNIVKIILDQVAGIAYLKVGNNKNANINFSFKAATFYEQNTPPDDVYVLQGGYWRRASVLEQNFGEATTAHLDSAPMAKYLIDGVFAAKLPVIDGQARFVGFMASPNEFISALAITRLLPAILSRGVVEYPSLGVDGWFNEEAPILVNGSRQSGFVISRVWQNGVLKRGDVISEINGAVVNPGNWWYAVSGNSSVNIKIWRAGKTQNVSSKIIKFIK